MLRKSNTNDKISTFEQLCGVHAYNAHPFAILGTAVEVHAMPGKRRTWDAHTKPGFYLGPSWEHYKCHEFWVQETKHIAQPYLTMSDALILPGEKLCNALSGKAPNNNATASAIKQLMEIYRKNVEEEQTNVDAQRMKRAVAQAQRVEGEAKRDTKAWTRTDEIAKRFLTTLKSGPPWRTVVRRVTRRLDTMECIEDIDVDSTVEDTCLHRALPEDVVGTKTTLYHQNKSKADTAEEEAELPAEAEKEEP